MRTLTILSGAGLPRPVSAMVSTSVDNVQVKLVENGRSGFQITLTLDRAGISGVIDYPLLTWRWFERFHRVVLIAVVYGWPHVLLDGVVTNRELTTKPARLVVTGEDLGVLMDVEERNAEYPALNDAAVAALVLARYARYGVIPQVIPPLSADIPTPVERIPVQVGTDLDHLTMLAQRHGYVFHLAAGPLPLTSTAYWGPAVPNAQVAPAISFGSAPFGNVENLSFRADGLAPERVRGRVQDRRTNQTFPVLGIGGLRPPLSVLPVRVTNGMSTRTTAYRGSGVTVTEALATANAAAEASADAVTAVGRVDSRRYSGVLRPRNMVGVTGAGWQHDGWYRVREVTHTIARGSHTQDFTLTREGLGSTVPAVRP